MGCVISTAEDRRVREALVVLTLKGCPVRERVTEHDWPAWKVEPRVQVEAATESGDATAGRLSKVVVAGKVMRVVSVLVCSK